MLRKLVTPGIKRDCQRRASHLATGYLEGEQPRDNTAVPERDDAGVTTGPGSSRGGPGIVFWANPAVFHLSQRLIYNPSGGEPGGFPFSCS